MLFGVAVYDCLHLLSIPDDILFMPKFERQIIKTKDGIIYTDDYSKRLSSTLPVGLFLQCRLSKSLNLTSSRLFNLFEMPANFLFFTGELKKVTINFSNEIQQLQLGKLLSFLLHITKGQLQVPIDLCADVEDGLQILQNLKQQVNANCWRFFEPLHSLYEPVVVRRDYKIYAQQKLITEPEHQTIIML